MPSENNFNYLFIKRFIQLFRAILSNPSDFNGHFYSHPLTLILLITVNQISLQFVIYLVGLLPSEYNFQLGKSPSERNLSEFHWLIIRSFLYVAINALLKSLSTFLSSILSIQ
ncbi:unnamed protein product [Adineta ricciae]|uniref:Uncharacterized protein n=1 Tax=Adineta ricciae TaxID=249248 RepID=A0A815A2G7_ADIRI|nr:unnamed protein product [Adineta ricciae]